jgi:hypothetical protein
MIDRLKHEKNLCGGWKPKILMGKPFLSTKCMHCVAEFNEIKELWCKKIKDLWCDNDK